MEELFDKEELNKEIAENILRKSNIQKVYDTKMLNDLLPEYQRVMKISENVLRT